MLSDFSEVVQLMNSRTGLQSRSPKPTTCTALPLSSHRPGSPGLLLPRTAQMESGRAKRPSLPTFLSIHWKLLLWAQICQNRGKKRKGHCSQPFARISELKMEDLSFAW